VGKRGIVFRIFVDFVGLLFVFLITGNTEVGQYDILFFIATVSAIIDQVSFLGDFHVV
jgi:hypothetical protein